MNPSSTPTSLPGGPLGRYLLHPGQETSHVFHHVLRVLEAAGTVAVPVLLSVLVAVVVGRLVLVALRRTTSGAGTGHVVVVSPGPEVEPSGAEALWNGLHGVLRRRGWRGAVSGRPHVAFEVGSSAGRLCFALWVPAGVPAVRVARVAEAAWPGAVPRWYRRRLRCPAVRGSQRGSCTWPSRSGSACGSTSRPTPTGFCWPPSVTSGAVAQGWSRCLPARLGPGGVGAVGEQPSRCARAGRAPSSCVSSG